MFMKLMRTCTFTLAQGILRPTMQKFSPLLNISSRLPSFPIEFSRSVRFGMEYQPNNLQRKRKHGFLARKRTAAGRRTLERRRKKGRKFLSH